MAYVAQSDLVGLVPQDYLTAAQDDANDGETAAVWASLAEAVDQDINGRLAATFSTPLSTVPDAIKSAAKAIACFFLFKRRGAPDDQNPWTALAKFWQDKLDRIGSGQEPLSHDQTRASDPAVAITEDARTHSAAGSLMS